jgi:hypothetical protein
MRQQEGFETGLERRREAAAAGRDDHHFDLLALTAAGRQAEGAGLRNTGVGAHQRGVVGERDGTLQCQQGCGGILA